MSVCQCKVWHFVTFYEFWCKTSSQGDQEIFFLMFPPDSLLKTPFLMFWSWLGLFLSSFCEQFLPFFSHQCWTKLLPLPYKDMILMGLVSPLAIFSLQCLPYRFFLLKIFSFYMASRQKICSKLCIDTGIHVQWTAVGNHFWDACNALSCAKMMAGNKWQSSV